MTTSDPSQECIYSYIWPLPECLSLSTPPAQLVFLLPLLRPFQEYSKTSYSNFSQLQLCQPHQRLACMARSLLTSSECTQLCTSLREEKQRQVATIKKATQKSRTKEKDRTEGTQACWLGDMAETAGMLCVCYTTYLDDVDSGRQWLEFSCAKQLASSQMDP